MITPIDTEGEAAAASFLATIGALQLLQLYVGNRWGLPPDRDPAWCVAARSRVLAALAAPSRCSDTTYFIATLPSIAWHRSQEFVRQPPADWNSQCPHCRLPQS
jgi:hypothetical protein